MHIALAATAIHWPTSRGAWIAVVLIIWAIMGAIGGGSGRGGSGSGGSTNRPGVHR